MAAKKDATPTMFPTIKKRNVVGLTIAVSLAFILLFYPLVQGTNDEFEHDILTSVPNFELNNSKTHSPEHPYFNHKNQFRRSQKSCGAALSVFKGREARLNHAIFQTLAIKGPQTIHQLQKHLHKQKDLQGTYYASIMRRIHCLEKAGYIAQSLTCKGPGSKAGEYELCTKAYLAAFMNYHSPEELLNKVTDKDAKIVLSDMIHVIFGDQEECQLHQ
jgi:hypothetical protein